jgi:Tol biopolymer transport system component
MKAKILSIIVVMLSLSCNSLQAQTMIGKNNIKLANDLMTPEALWAMGRLSSAKASPDGKQVVYQVSYYSVKENKSHTMLFIQDANGKNKKQLTTSAKSETDPAWIENGQKIAYLFDGQLWKMNPDGSGKVKLTNSEKDIEGFLFSPDGKSVILLKSIDYQGSIQKNPEDLPKATGRVITDMNYRHWDHYVESITHPFVAQVTANSIAEGIDLLDKEPFECPTAPFGGIEQLAWSPDSKYIAYTCRKKEGVEYAISTDTDIYLYDTSTKTTRNLCKPEGYVEPKIDPTKTMKDQAVNKQDGDMNVGYDQNPKFSPDGKYVAWQSMKRDGYESDLNRLCVYELANGRKHILSTRIIWTRMSMIIAGIMIQNHFISSLVGMLA